jgi:hypothetical protein
LHEGAGQPLGFPRGGRVAGAKPDHDVLGAHRLARLQREVADDPVALVEQGDHGHPVGHRGGAGAVGRRHRHVDGHRLAGFGLVGAAIAAGEAKAERGQPEERRLAHAWSGVQAL